MQKLLQSFTTLLLCGWAIQADAAGTHRKSGKRSEPAFSARRANDPGKTPRLTPASAASSSVLRAQVLLDRAHFSPGEIDGRYGGNTRRAVAAFNRAHGLKGGENVDAKSWAALNADKAPVVVPYALSSEDVGPFETLPVEISDRAKRAALGFESPAEALGEKFHASPALLRALNPGTSFDGAGVEVQVPNVERVPLPKVEGLRVRVSESDHSAEAVGPDGKVLARYPATVGSEHDPLPIGPWKINGVAWNPTFRYNPDLFWDSEPGDEKAKLPPGPNSPVGVVWIDLSKPHYGIHGTPEPTAIGGTTSHGCIRLTNWDAVELGRLVSPGTAADLVR